jgi:uncharacterized Zn ribbon protein
MYRFLICLIEKLATCPSCKSPYEMEGKLVSPEYDFNWLVEAEVIKEERSIVKNSNSPILFNGNAALLVKGLPIRGVPKPIEARIKLKIK